jgi:hypothetical protein
MSCGKKASYEHEQDIEDALKKVGLDEDKVWGTIHRHVAEVTVLTCAKAGASKNDTIRALHRERALIEADAAARAEIDERATLAKLAATY